MTVSAQVPENQFVGNGTTTIYSFNFELTTGTDLVVYVGSTLAVLNADYSLGSFTTSGGTITFAVAPALGVIVTLTRQIPLSRSVDYQSNGSFDAVDVNSDFDRLWLGLQQQQLQLAATITAPAFDTPANLTLPIAATRANQFLSFNSSGNLTIAGGSSGGIAISPAMTPVVQATTLSAALALIGANTKLANNLGTVAASVPTGTTIVGIGYTTDQGGGQKLQVNGGAFINGTLSLVGSANGVPTSNGQGYFSTASAPDGLQIFGKGSTNDIELRNATGGLALNIPTGTVNVQVAGNLGVTGQIQAGSGSSFVRVGFHSTSQTFPVPGATKSLAHGLGATPFIIYGILQCTTANLGYAVGQQVALTSVYDSSVANDHFTVSADATDVYITATSAGVPSLPNFATGTGAPITTADWALFVNAWL